MPATVKEMLDAANAVVPKITMEEATALAAAGKAVIVDVRDSAELAEAGKVQGAVHIPRGSLEFRADAGTSYHDPRLDPAKTVILYCAAGSRAPLAGKASKDMGYADVRNLGGFKAWVDAGGAVER
ncbi:MAG: rhodanese-like domain-containing protein [Alphaproteobacteria bacterium]|nr:rhodanese-like domain-containing protein [Alphaproteobacteria bacterium]